VNRGDVGVARTSRWLDLRGGGLNGDETRREKSAVEWRLRWLWSRGERRPGDGGASSSLELGPEMAGGFLGARRGVERGRMARIRLGFGRGGDPAPF